MNISQLSSAYGFIDSKLNTLATRWTSFPKHTVICNVNESGYASQCEGCDGCASVIVGGQYCVDDR